MNFSAEKASRKWPCGSFRRSAAAMVTAARAADALRSDQCPLPRRRRRAPGRRGPGAACSGRPGRRSRAGPWCSRCRCRSRARPRRPKPKPDKAESAKPEPDKPAAKPEPDKPAETATDKAAEQAAPAPPPPSACRLALTDAIAIAPSIPDIKGAGGCGGEDLVRLEAVVLPDKRRVSVKPAAILRCAMASAIADWIRTDMAPLAAEPRQPHQRSRQFQFVRVPRPQPRGRRQAVRARPRQRARYSRPSSSPTAARSR